MTIGINPSRPLTITYADPEGSCQGCPSQAGTAPFLRADGTVLDLCKRCIVKALRSCKRRARPDATERVR